MSKPILSAKNICLSYTLGRRLISKVRHPVLSDISFDLMPGETLGILGRNGVGKSSLLRILAGIINPTSGEVTTLPNVTRALLTLGLGFMPYVSGRENAIYSAMLQGMTKRDAKSAVHKIEEFSELGQFFDQPVSTYSSGMRSRLGFSTALFTNVDILLIDETLSVGDKEFKIKAEEAMLNKLRSSQSCVFVSHDANQVNKVCNRAIWIHEGTIKEQGATKDVTKLYNASHNNLIKPKMGQ